MATRSVIGQVQENGKIKVIYCHWDGYLEHVGQTLADHYDSDEKVSALIALGDLSTLGPDLGEKHSKEDTLKARGPMTTAYGRDLEQDGTEAQEFSSVEDFLMYGEDVGAEFFYLFEDGEGWNYYSNRKTFQEIKPSTLAEV